MRWQGWAVLAGMVVAAAAHAADGVSFAEVRAQVYAQPLASPPVYAWDTVPELSLVQGLVTGLLTARLAGTLASQEDFKEPGPKPIHRAGVCADAVWRITERTAATGLLAAGTTLPALVRFAVGTNRTVGNGFSARPFGFAVKLFPSPDPERRVTTSNLFIFDQYGLDGDTRPHFLQPAPGTPPLQFSNVVVPSGIAGKLGNLFLGRFDNKPDRRELYPLTGVDASGAPVAVPLTPYELRLVPRPVPADTVPPDYRDELMAYAPGTLVFDILLPAETGVRAAVPLGTLTVGQMVMSRVCDETLHFPHPRAR